MVSYHLVQWQLGEFVSIRITFSVVHIINSYDLCGSSTDICVGKKGEHY